MKEKMRLWSDNWCIEKNKAWFVDGMNNILFSIDLSTKQCESAVYIPEKSLGTFRLTPYCIKYDNKIFCFPRQGKNIWIFDLERKNFSKIHIEKPSEIQTAFEFEIWNDKIYAVAEGWNRILEIDIKQKKIDYHIVCEERSLAKSAFTGGMAYSLSDETNNIYQFDLSTKIVKKYTISGINKMLYSICVDGNRFWLSGYGKVIYVWDKESNTIKTIDSFPQDFGVYNFEKDAVTVLDCEAEEYKYPAFAYSISTEAYVWFIPHQTNKILYVDKKSFKLQVFEMDEENETKESLLMRSCLAHKFLLEYVKDNRYIGLFSLKNNCIFEIDTKELRYHRKDYYFSDKCLKDCVEIKRKSLFMEGNFLERAIYKLSLRMNGYDTCVGNTDNTGVQIYKKLMNDLSE